MAQNLGRAGIHRKFNVEARGQQLKRFLNAGPLFFLGQALGPGARRFGAEV